MRAIVVAPLLILAVITDTTAQDLLAQPGQRVRVSVPSRDLRKRQDTFERVSGDTLVLQSLRLPLSDVARLERYAGRGFRTGNVLKWGSLGLVTGAALSFGVAYASYGDQCFNGEEEQVICTAGTAIGAGALMLIGGAIGAFIKSDKWEEVPLDRLRVSIAPQGRGRLGLGMSIAF